MVATVKLSKNSLKIPKGGNQKNLESTKQKSKDWPTKKLNVNILPVSLPEGPFCQQLEKYEVRCNL